MRFVLLSFAGILVVAYFITYMSEGSREAVRRVLVGAPVLAALYALAIFIIPLAGSWEGSLWWTLDLTIALTELGFILTWPGRRKRAGKPILVLDRSRQQKIMVVLGGIGTLSGLVLTADSLRGVASVRDVSLALLVLFTAPMFLFEGLIGTRFTQRGILHFTRFVEWPSIVSHGWRKTTAITLITRLRGRRFDPFDLRGLFWRRFEWEVPVGQRDTVESIVRRMLAPKATGTGGHMTELCSRSSRLS